MGEPFADWLSTAHPEDATVMYVGSDRWQQLPESSIGLWERRTREYVAAESAEMVEIAETFMRARNAYDSEKAMSLLADDGVTAVPVLDNKPDLYMNLDPVQLRDDELALAFEAERLYGVEYEDVECRVDPGPVASGISGRHLHLLDGLKAASTGQISAGRVGLRARGPGRADRSAELPRADNQLYRRGVSPRRVRGFRSLARGPHPEAGRSCRCRHLPQEILLGSWKLLGSTPARRPRTNFPNGRPGLDPQVTRESLDPLKRYLEDYERSVG